MYNILLFYVYFVINLFACLFVHLPQFYCNMRVYIVFQNSTITAGYIMFEKN